MDGSMYSLINAFTRCAQGLEEEKVKNLLVTPLLVCCYLSTGRSWKDVWSNFYFGRGGRGGRGEVDIKIKVSENTFVLVEVKSTEESVDLPNEGRSGSKESISKRKKIRKLC